MMKGEAGRFIRSFVLGSAVLALLVGVTPAEGVAASSFEETVRRLPDPFQRAEKLRRAVQEKEDAERRRKAEEERLNRERAKNKPSVTTPAQAETKLVLDTSAYKLTGIIYDAPVPVAIINGQVLRVGEVVAEASVGGAIRLIRIKSGGVLLSYAGESYALLIDEVQGEGGSSAEKDPSIYVREVK
ncbi:MAG: general secretion pathway protein GspB [Elusimicrobia bacterium]|nr:general secretion pathway protein GspB [Elusimicrobiota bacterium]